MFYVYVLYSTKSKRLYTGRTDNLKRRLIEHNTGHGGRYSSINRPYKLVFYEAYLDKKDAIKQELFLKTGYGREVLHNKIVNSLVLMRD